MKEEEIKTSASEPEDDGEKIRKNLARTEQDKKEVDYGKKMTSSLKKRNDKRYQRR
jgi:hypothetical protein